MINYCWEGRLHSPIVFLMQNYRHSSSIVGSAFTAFFVVISSLLIATNVTASNIESDAKKQAKKVYQAMLAGGSLKTCSSFALSNCKSRSLPENAKHELLYQISGDSLNRLELFILKESNNLANQDLKSLIPSLQKYESKEGLTKSQLFDVFDDLGIKGEVNQLTDPAYYALLDHLEMAQLDDNGMRKREIASVFESKSSAAIKVYQRFVDQLNLRKTDAQEKAHLLIVTASSRDAFEVVDFYESVFKAFNVKTTWLPIDSSLSATLALKDSVPNACTLLDDIRAQHNVFDRQRVYPKLHAQQKQACNEPQRITDLIESAQGIFINGGDQSKTLASLRNAKSEYHNFWQLALDRVSSGELIVGGTSAGAAVQAGRVYNQLPIPMISNGLSSNALGRGAFAAMAPSVRCTDQICERALGADDLTFMPTGGANTFNIGTVDTHFSERDREGRLIVLALQQKTRLAVGVDETTALFYAKNEDEVDFEVVGQSGVFIVDGQNSMLTNAVVQGRSSTQYAGFAHYLPSGTVAKLNLVTDNWTLSSNMTPLNERKKLKAADVGIWRNTTRQYCGSGEPTSWEVDSHQYLLSPNENTQFFIDNSRKHCGYLYLPFLLQ